VSRSGIGATIARRTASLCSGPDVIRRSDLRATRIRIEDSRSDLAAELRRLRPPVDKPAGHRGGPDTDFPWLMYLWRKCTLTRKRSTNPRHPPTARSASYSPARSIATCPRRRTGSGFLDGNPIVGYSKLKNCVRLLFWSGQSFDEEGLKKEGKFKAAEARYTAVDEVDTDDLARWLEKARDIQWDYRNIVRRKGRLERLK
jgi:hypothetical protein